MKAYDKGYMKIALEQANVGLAQNEVPVGAVLVMDDRVIAAAHNAPISLNDPCAHAEMLVLRQAGSVLGNYRLNGATLYVTLEPCPMCVYAMIHARIARCVYAASDLKTGACGGAIDLPRLHAWNHTLVIDGGVLAEESSALIKHFFQARRL